VLLTFGNAAIGPLVRLRVGVRIRVRVRVS